MTSFARYLFRCACSGAAGVVTAAVVVHVLARRADSRVEHAHYPLTHGDPA